MELALIFIIVLLIGYSVFKDVTFAKEREKLQLKLMSKDLIDYTNATESPPPDTVQEENPYVPIEEASITDILKSKDIV